MNTVSDTAPPDKPPMGFFSRLIAVYFEPSKAFEDLSRHPRWLALAILMAFLSFVMIGAVVVRLDPQTYMRKAIEQSPRAKSMSEEQKQQAIAQAASNPALMYFGVVVAPFATILVYVVLAGIYLLVFMLMGASITFKQSLAATVWSAGPPGLILSILYIVFTFVKGVEDMEPDPRNNVVTSLGVLASAKESPVLYAFLSSIDVFSIWVIFLLGVAFSRMSGGKLSTGKAAACIIALWAIYVVGKMGFAALGLFR